MLDNNGNSSKCPHLFVYYVSHQRTDLFLLAGLQHGFHHSCRELGGGASRAFAVDERMTHEILAAVMTQTRWMVFSLTPTIKLPWKETHTAEQQERSFSRRLKTCSSLGCWRLMVFHLAMQKSETRGITPSVSVFWKHLYAEGKWEKLCSCIMLTLSHFNTEFILNVL